MNIEEVRTYYSKKTGTTESFPFDDETLVVKVGTKIYLIIGLEYLPPKICVKTRPQYSLELRENYPQIRGAYHMNKTHWNELEIEDLPKKLILELIDESYDLVFQSLTKKMKEELLISK